MSRLILDEPGKEILFMGNEAIARGALEAGVRVAAAYPGNPSSEIIGNLAHVAKEMGIYVEWSVNEKVAAEVAAAGAVSNMNALVAMKQNGLNVACDFLLNLNLTGIRGGLVLVVADDPSGISSSNEQDSRSFAKLADIPLLEPATFQEAKEMVREGFELSRRNRQLRHGSERYKNISCSRECDSRSTTKRFSRSLFRYIQAFVPVTDLHHPSRPPQETRSGGRNPGRFGIQRLLGT